MVDDNGNAAGPWTSDLLATAISQIDANDKGVDLRTVQLWFQDNDKGVSAENIHWLAVIFGCGDPEATMLWRAELSAANRRLAAKRKANIRKKNRQGNVIANAPSLTAKNIGSDVVDNHELVPKRSTNLAQKTEAVFSNQSSMALPLITFIIACAIALIAFSLNIHSIRYELQGGQLKQVGFLWAPNWTIVFLFLLPLFYELLIRLLGCWKEELRPALEKLGGATLSRPSWELRLRSSSAIFWATFVITVVVASFYNWIVTHLIPLLSGHIGSWPVDWGRVAIIRPELISIPNAIFFSALAFLFNAFVAYFFFTGQILLHLMKHDYLDLAKQLTKQLGRETKAEFRNVSLVLMYGIYRCCAVGLLITIMMKLQSSYLNSEAPDIVSWLVSDVHLVWAGSHLFMASDWGWGIAPGFYYSFVCVLAIVGTYVNASVKMRWTMENLGVNKFDGRPISPWLIMDGGIVLLVISYLLLGAVQGFSIILLFVLVVTGFLLSKPRLLNEQSAKIERPL